MNDIYKIGLIIGTRPEIIKMAPIISYLSSANIQYFIIHSGQHFTKNMNDSFLELFGISSKIKYQMERRKNPSKNLSYIISETQKILSNEKPDLFFIQGDTDTGVASAIAASKSDVKIGHIEAGLRSYDLSMPEERNRIIIDHLSAYNFCPTYCSEKNLRNEDLNNTFLVGNTIVDSLWYIKNMASRINRKFIKPNTINRYILLTLHRPSNVDSFDKLNHLLKNISGAARDIGIQVLFPVHPRTKKYLIEQYKNIIYIESLNYMDFVYYETNALLIITDSGGVQEEACILKTPCVTIRENTERPETVEIGANILCNGEHEDLEYKIKLMMEKKYYNNWSHPFGDPNVTKRIFKIILSLQNY